MWYNVYLLLAILTSFLESLCFKITIQLDTPSGADRESTETPVPNGHKEININDITPSVNSSISCVKREKPDFSKLGRSISDWKCMEYIYQMLERQESQNLGCSHDVTIINGKSVQPAEFPHMGALGWSSYSDPHVVYLCGGSLISENFLLTAAHCSQVSSQLVHTMRLTGPKPILVRLGTRNIEKSQYEIPKDIYIERLIVHRRYHSPSHDYDIALVKLKEKVKFTQYIQPACLPHREYFVKDNLQITVTGWGKTSDRGDTEPELLYAAVKVFDQLTCDSLLQPFKNRYWDGLRSNQMCAGQMDGATDTCQGDSGGPLQFKLMSTSSQGSIHKLLGVTSFGLTKCGKKNAPGIYTKVSSFINWIEPIVWPLYDDNKYTEDFYDVQLV